MVEGQRLERPVFEAVEPPREALSLAAAESSSFVGRQALEKCVELEALGALPTMG